MSEDFKTAETEKLIKGNYDYYKDDNIYCQERFEVLRHLGELTTEFASESLSRVATGEMLKVIVHYKIGKDWLPKEVSIERTLGTNHVKETFEIDQRTNRLHYHFHNLKDDTVEEQITPTPPRFQIATPTVASSFLFIMTKKFDNTGDNNYVLLASTNKWDYEEEISQRFISLRKVGTAEEEIKIAQTKFYGNRYTLKSIENTDEFSIANIENNDQTTVNIFLSKYISIPFEINQPDGVSIRCTNFASLADNI